MCKFSETTKDKLGNALIYMAERVQGLEIAVPNGRANGSETSCSFLRHSL